MAARGTALSIPEAEWHGLSAGCGFARDPVLTSLAAFRAQGLTPEIMLRVAGARVILANYALLIHDFPVHVASLLGRHVHSERDLTESETQVIDNWLVSQTAFISAPQSAQSYANTPISLTAETRKVHRPPRYFRAAVMCAANPGGGPELALFDVKGCGVPACTIPVLPNSNGLLTISEAIFEFVMERLVYAALRHSGSAARPVPAYGIIDLGFDALQQGPNGRERATVLLRRAQTRPRFQWGHADPGPLMAGLLLEIELTLRRYGITASSCGAMRFRIASDRGTLAVTRDEKVLAFNQAKLEKLCQATNFVDRALTIDGINVQIADGAVGGPPCCRILDFGRYRLKSAFDAIAYTWWTRDYESLEGEFVLPDSSRYVQPDPALSMADLEAEREWRALWDAAESYQNGDLDRRALTRALNAAVGTATARVAGAM